ncbi:protein transport protein Sec31A, putative, partial [Ixodes scapularis]
FSTSAALEIYSLNLTEPGLDMGLVGTLNSEHRFHKVAWGCHGISEGDLPSGVLVGGADAGNLLVYDPAKLIKGEDALICQKDKHTGPVYALDFNTFQANLLASGSTDSEIFIWDLNSPNAPMTPGAKSQPHEDISCLAWNRQVQHILASTFPARCIVWDLRKNEPIIKVSDTTSRIHCKAVAWHPEVATQLCLASEDDHAPVVQLWDLRFATSPLKTLEHHQKGVLAIAWCPQDPDLLLSCGKDKRILCWNPNSNVAGGEIPTGDQWHFDVAWCPRNPAVISSASFDGHVGIYSLLGGQQQTQPSTKLAESFPGADDFAQLPSFQQQQAAAQRSVSISLLKPPKWLRKPVGASFGFGGKLISFTKQQQPNAGAPAAQLVHISQVVTEQKLMAQSAQLESALSTGNFSDFCQLKVQASSDTNRQLAWSFLQANFDRSPRARMLSLLGYDPEDVSGQVSACSVLSLASLEQRVDSTAVYFQNGEILDDSASAFDSIAAKSKEQDFVPFTITTDEGEEGGDADGLLNRALLTGNVEAAVNLLSGASLVLRWCLLHQPLDIWILKGTNSPESHMLRYILAIPRLISAVVNSNWSNVVKNCEINCWKEALAAVLTYAKPEDFPVLCETLGKRLETERNSTLVPYAMLCYICAGNLEKLASCWVQLQKKADSPQSLQELVEQVMILRAAVAQLGGQPQSIQTGTLSNLLGQYAAILAAQGSLTSSINYLLDPTEPGLAVLRDRVYQCLGMASPHFPFPRVSVRGEFAPASANAVNSRPGVGAQARMASTSSSRVQPFYHGGQQASSTSQMQPQAPPPAPPLSSSSNSGNAPPGWNDPPPVRPSTKVRIGFCFRAVGGGGGGSARALKPEECPQRVLPFCGQAQQTAAAIPTFDLTASIMTPLIGAPAPTMGEAPPPGFQGGYVPPLGQQFVPQQPPLPSGAIGGPVSVPQDQQKLLEEGSCHPGLLVCLVNVGQTACTFQAPWLHKSADDGKLHHLRDATKKSSPSLCALLSALASLALEAKADRPPSHLSILNPLATVSKSCESKVTCNTRRKRQIVFARQPAPQVCPPAPVKEKGPIPPENQVLQDTFEDLRQNCVQAATNPQVRRKLDDVARKLEHLYDRLRENVLSAATTHGLHQIVQMIQQGDYAAALGIHSHLVSTSNFSETSSFMPGLKALLQVAQQLGVFLQ